MWPLETWFSGGLGSIRFTVGLSDLKSLFQPKQFILFCILWREETGKIKLKVGGTISYSYQLAGLLLSECVDQIICSWMD